MNIEQPGTVQSIYTAYDKGQPMQKVNRAQIIEGRGLLGDRYAEGRGAYSRSKESKVRHISLIAAEAIAAANEGLELPYDESETRRNIVTAGIELNGLVGVEFYIGDVLLRGVELCDPCRRPERLIGKPGFEEAFQNRGGLRAEALSSGLIVVRDTVARVS